MATQHDIPMGVLCDEDGAVAVCETCGQVHSPYWSARKSATRHRRATGHRVEVMHASVLLTRIHSPNAPGPGPAQRPVAERPK